MSTQNNMRTLVRRPFIDQGYMPPEDPAVNTWLWQPTWINTAQNYFNKVSSTPALCNSELNGHHHITT